MIFRILPVSLALSTCAQHAPAQQPPTWQVPPKLVVGIVVDQMRADYIYRYWDNFGDGGFKRLVNDGAFLRDAHFDYAPTYTAPGHASIYTGTSPALHGIVGNDLFDRKLGRDRYCAEDTTRKTVGMAGGVGQRSPINLLATTLADELERRTERRSRTIGIALKDRSAIFPIGRTGDAAYWFGGGPDGAFVTSTWYTNELPAWLQRFNAERPAVKHLANTWDLLLPRERYHEVLPDDNPYEMPLAGTLTPTLPVDLKALYTSSGSTGIITYTPWGNTLTTDLALAAMEGEDLGMDGITDLLAMSYSSPDILGHRVGPRALELEDMYVRLDRELERLFKALDQRVGDGRYTVFLTADHAGVDVPAYLKDLKGSAGYVDLTALRAELEQHLQGRFGAGPWVSGILNEQVYLNDTLIVVRKLDPEVVQRATAQFLVRHPDIAHAYAATDLLWSDHSSGIGRALQRGFMVQRSGDVAFVMRQGYFERYGSAVGKGTTHGSPWNYDTHVPILFMGQGIQHTEVVRRTSITDIAPTLSMVLGMTMPDAASGTVVGEVLRR